jgi:DNA-binding NarL/FixJ family response regulator
MRANYLHGKRMAEADYKRAIAMAIEHKLLRSEHAKDVVPEVVALVGCSVRTAQLNTGDYREAMIEKRNRLILALHLEGRTQEMIGAKLEVDQSTIARVIERLMQKRKVHETHKDRPSPPTVDWPRSRICANERGARV